MSMRVTLLNRIKYPLGIIAAAGALTLSAPIRTTAQKHAPDITQTIPDRFEKSLSGRITDSIMLSKAPAPDIQIQGKKKIATLVVDIKNNLLYRYNETGKAVEAFKMACGNPRTPTPAGISVVTRILEYPYRSLPPWTKRRKHPDDYGPRILELNVVDARTGELHDNGVYIHGTKNPNAIGKKWTHGCVRVHNKDILDLVTKVKVGQYVHFIK